MDRRDLLVGAHPRQFVKERLHVRRGPRHRRFDHPPGAGDVADHRQDEGADALGRGVAARHQRRQRGQRAGAVLAHRQAQGQPAAGLVAILAQQRGAVVGLGQRRFPGQIISESAVGADGHLARAEPRRFGEIAKRLDRILHRHQRGAGARLGRGAARMDLLGAAEEADRSLGIAQRERGTAGADQRLEAARGSGEQANVARQSGRWRLGISDPAWISRPKLRKRGRRQAGRKRGRRLQRQGRKIREMVSIDWRMPHRSLPKAC